MERIAVDPGLWARLTLSAADLPRTVQASLTTLGLLMSPSGSVHNAIAHLVCLSARSRPTISEHLGAAQASGWLTCLERGGNRANGATTSVYQATVPAEVWHHREELLAVFEQEPDQAGLPSFPVGSVIPAQDHRGPSSEFSAPKINPSISRQEAPTWLPVQDSAVASDTDPVIAATIEELAALTDQVVSPAWAARCVSQIMRHRRVRHPIAYVVKTLQNAAQDATLAERFLPTAANQPLPRSEPMAPAQNERAALPGSASVATFLHEAPWETATLSSSSDWDEQELMPVSASIAGRHQTQPAGHTAGGAEILQDPPHESYQPEGRTLIGLGQRGTVELARLRRQFAEHHRLKNQAAAS